MHKALQVELQDWQRDQEPDTDHEGFYRTSLPTMITQVKMQAQTLTHTYLLLHLSDLRRSRGIIWSQTGGSTLKSSKVATFVMLLGAYCVFKLK